LLNLLLLNLNDFTKLKGKVMRSTRPIIKTLSALTATTAVVMLWWTLESPGLNSAVAAGQDEKKAVTPSEKPEQKEGSGDKKDEPAGSLHRFMRQKMQASNLILEGLCMDDLKTVAAGTQTLMKMPSEAKWRVSNDMMYRRYSNEFVQAVEELQKEAEENDIDGASMAWVNVTMKCMKCHKWVRNTVLAESNK
jgi:hypothetical protein